ncbi:SDR family NAD(P)-dependent oxidoreductase [Agrobacterium sp. NPDC090273]|uniref:SDR family NAD(P)-dependent oxidoreductase n=1 Tax=Agrobacterium sp. NPDC090273 TaxID=3363919 RepID=UPI00383AC015
MKTFLSIGTGPGIGIETAARFASEGFRVVLASRDTGKTDEIAKAIRAKGGEVVVKHVDASKPSAVATLVKNVQKNFGQIDVLHYNAATLRHATIADQPLGTFVDDLAVNIGGALAAIQTAGPAMREKKEGTILLTGGGFALFPHPEYLSISIGKAGIRALAQGLFEDYKAHGVHVATVTVAGFVSPGTSQTSDIAEHFWKLHAQSVDDWTVETVYEP